MERPEELAPEDIIMGGVAYVRKDSKLSDELRTKIFEALGEASMCWIPRPTGEFDSTNTERIGNELIEEIEKG